MFPPLIQYTIKIESRFRDFCKILQKELPAFDTEIRKALYVFRYYIILRFQSQESLEQFQKEIMPLGFRLTLR